MKGKNMKRILVACGNGVATSTVVASKIRDYCKDKGVDVKTEQCRMIELHDKADDYEYQIGECVRQILALQGIDDYPQFKRNRISNQYEQVQMVMLEAEYLDEETVLNKLPNVTPDEVEGIMQRKAEQERSVFVRDGQSAGFGNMEEQS